jgi:transposase InsO family protein
VKAYQEKGPKGLESGIYGSHFKKRGAPRSIPDPVREEIAKVKVGNPGFGFKRIRNFLYRFRGVKVSTGTVRKTLAEKDLPKATQTRCKPKRHKKVHHFERARAMQLWQSDITSFVLTRHGVRVYLVVFMDDHSRYVVSWGLNLRQTGEFVIEALQSGIERFGKPEEVLTDQGRQYYAWRGKSDFGKLLIKEGIKHVVARSHHPQTLGKCERFWETVGQEFWERVHPPELSEARERFSHFIARYNHFRPHQGIDGMVPADRFFGLENEVRKELERGLKDNEIRLAIGEVPRTPVFLIGQIGNQPLSLHGEGGRLILQTEAGLKTLESEYFGCSEIKKEQIYERIEADEDGSHSNGDIKGQGTEASIHTPAIGEESLGKCEKTASSPSSSQGDTFDRILVGKEDSGASGQSSTNTCNTGVAVITTSGIGDGGRVIAPPQEQVERGTEITQEKDRGVREDHFGSTATYSGDSGTSGSEITTQKDSKTSGEPWEKDTTGSSQ